MRPHCTCPSPGLFHGPDRPGGQPRQVEGGVGGRTLPPRKQTKGSSSSNGRAISPARFLLLCWKVSHEVTDGVDELCLPGPARSPQGGGQVTVDGLGGRITLS